MRKKTPAMPSSHHTACVQLQSAWLQPLGTRRKLCTASMMPIEIDLYTSTHTRRLGAGVGVSARDGAERPTLERRGESAREGERARLVAIRAHTRLRVGAVHGEHGKSTGTSTDARRPAKGHGKCATTTRYGDKGHTHAPTLKEVAKATHTHTVGRGRDRFLVGHARTDRGVGSGRRLLLVGALWRAVNPVCMRVCIGLRCR